MLTVDALEPEVSGIGRYTWELASRLAAHGEIESLSLYGGGRCIESAEWLRVWPKQFVEARRGVKLPRWVRDWQSRRRARGHIFHAPNYFLPRFIDGGVATIHDLSVVRFPEAHPVTRVRQFERELAPT